MNARAASEPGVVALMATDICARISGSTNLTTLVVPTTGKACNQQCGTIVAHAPAPTTAYSEGTESVSTCGRNATPLSPNALDHWRILMSGVSNASGSCAASTHLMAESLDSSRLFDATTT